MISVVTLLRRVFKSPSFASLSAFAGSNLLVAVVSGVTGLLQARWLSPADFGEFRKYGIAMSYLIIGIALVHDASSRHAQALCQ